MSKLPEKLAVPPPQVSKGTVELYTPKYYGLCILGGALACGPTHASVTPLDLVKCRRQVDPKLYRSNMAGWSAIYKGAGVPGLYFGWGPTLVGYCFQGAGKYGGYEYFKYIYQNAMPADTNKNIVYLSASASAEFVADIFLCPFEAVKVRMQTTLPPFAHSMREGLAKVAREEGIGSLYKGIAPLWARQIPYTMIKFASFENIVAAIYGQMPKKKEEYSSTVQTGVSFLGGYIAGIFCAVGSHPADVLVSKMNNERKPGESTGACISRIYGKIGFAGLWAGLPVRILMIGTLTGFQWLIYDTFKMYCGFPTTGGH